MVADNGTHHQEAVEEGKARLEEDNLVNFHLMLSTLPHSFVVSSTTSDALSLRV